MQDAVVAEIRSRLEQLARRERVTIAFAIESGSRAWGFPSPDSDYDCRFVFVRPLAETYTLFPARDVLEEPLTEVFDINGWELSKAIRLLLKGNAVILEWLNSPHAYGEVPGFRNAMLALAGQVGDRNLIGRHYYYLCREHVGRCFRDPETTALKKLFYLLRPLFAVQWLDAHPDAVYPPMNFHALRAGIDIPAAVTDEIDTLLARKAETRELGEGRIPPVLASYALEAYDRAGHWRRAVAVDQERQVLADRFWREWTERLAPSGLAVQPARAD
ncbi:nucleotidyltransferase domain-containing protein [Pannonibacter tanglangensis]|uniref:Nucleotidyltransferase n=1 Tax=Pannonibacter tanglangensis TaxID=2750084 RepID=A0ABW9ZLA2_9HYPH|nr:nucleotidyltransferase domain-containing protein [Pannonibacter sp. XCT-34]NBN65621.1 hypothetical protein [Pannonibacter sp. XCT-34]